MKGTSNDFFISCQEELATMLQEYGIDDRKISDIIESGYIKWNLVLSSNKPKIEPHVLDTFYGTKHPSGLIPFEIFIKYIAQDTIPQVPLGTKYYVVKSLQEAEEILSSERHSKYHDSGMLSFRGQTKEYWLKRKVPNPIRKDDSNKERFIAPSFWRFCINNHNPASRTVDQKSMLDMFKGHYPYSQIISERASNENVIHDLFHSGDISIVDQHYGRKTIGLDITYDLKTAFFFASHQFTEVEGASKKYTYLPIKKGEHKGIVYCFVFRDPLVKRTEWMIKSVDTFQHIPPLRPLRQSCALPYFHVHEVNAAATD